MTRDGHWLLYGRITDAYSSMQPALPSCWLLVIRTSSDDGKLLYVQYVASEARRFCMLGSCPGLDVFDCELMEEICRLCDFSLVFGITRYGLWCQFQYLRDIELGPGFDSLLCC